MWRQSLSNFEKSRTWYGYPFKILLNSLVANSGKFQLMILQKFIRSKYCLTIGPINVKELNHVELLGITIDVHLYFKKRIENWCWNANCKLHALRRIKKNLAVEKAKLLGNTFVDSQFNCAPLIWADWIRRDTKYLSVFSPNAGWMFCQKTLYLKIEKMLRIIHELNASCSDLLERNGSTSFQ